MNIVFDVGNVLLRWETGDLVRKLWPELRPAQAVDALFRGPHWAQLDAGTISFEDAVAEAAQRGGLPPARVTDFYQAIPGELAPIPELVTLLQELEARGDSRLFVLSNMPAYMQTALLERHAFFDCFERRVFSNEVGVNKPHRAIYQALLDPSGLNASECLFIDDRPENLTAAAAEGMHIALLPEGADASTRARVVQAALNWRP